MLLETNGLRFEWIDNWVKIPHPPDTPDSTTDFKPGRFNSPLSLAVDPIGKIYIVEWIIGGRVTKLACTS